MINPLDDPSLNNGDSEVDKLQFEIVDVEFSFPNHLPITHWILQVCKDENKALTFITFIFCSDEYLHQINVDYLQHDNYTDVITFPYAAADFIEGDIFISIDRVKDNANLFQSTFQNELYRVMIHGVFHLCGYLDKTEDQKKAMRAKEDAALTNLYANYLKKS